MEGLTPPDTAKEQQISPPEDGWQKVKPYLTPFRPEGCNTAKLEANEAQIEQNRFRHCLALSKYIRVKLNFSH